MKPIFFTIGPQRSWLSCISLASSAGVDEVTSTPITASPSTTSFWASAALIRSTTGDDLHDLERLAVLRAGAARQAAREAEGGERSARSADGWSAWYFPRYLQVYARTVAKMAAGPRAGRVARARTLRYVPPRRTRSSAG